MTSAGGLTRKQLELLNYIKSCPLTPSYDEMKAALGLKSKSGVNRLIVALEQRGRIARLPGCARSIQVLPDRGELGAVPTVMLLAELSARGFIVETEAA